MTIQSARWLKPFVIMMMTLWIQPFSIHPSIAAVLEWKFTPPGPGPDFDPTTLTFTLPASQTDINRYSAAADMVTLSNVTCAGGFCTWTYDSPSFLSPIYISPSPDNLMPMNAFWDYPSPLLTVAVTPSLEIQPVLSGYVSATEIIPEPSTWAMMLIGFAGLGFAGYRVSRRKAPVLT
jgi:hypothetical protein